MYSIIKKSLLTLSLVSLTFVFASSASASSANNTSDATLHAITASLAQPLTSKPTVTVLKASVSSFLSAGGSTTLSSTVKNGSKCVLSVSPIISGVAKTSTCKTGKPTTYKVTIPKNTSIKSRVYTFKLEATNSRGSVTTTIQIKQKGVTPSVNSFKATASQNPLPDTGGLVTLRGTIINGTSCKIAVSPAVTGFGGTVVCGSIGTSVTLPANSAKATIAYTFSATAINANGKITVTSSIIYVKGTGLTGINTITNPDINAPIAITSDGVHIWVTNYSGNSVTEINQSTGQVINTYSASTYKFSAPIALAISGSDLWVANNSSNSITELNTTNGAFVANYSASTYKFSAPIALAISGSDLWVANTGNSITEINASTGALVRVINASTYKFSQPSALTFDGTNIWVTNYTGNSITEINASTGALVNYISNTSGSYNLDGPNSLTFDGTNIWVTNYTGNSITEINASTGALVNYISNTSGSYNLDGPNSLTFDGTNIWVANLGTYSNGSYVGAGANSITEINASTGAYESTLSGLSYNFSGTISLYFDGTNLWVANFTGESVTEISL